MKKTWSEWFDENVGTADCTTNWNTDHHYDAIASYIGAKAICPAKKPGDEGISLNDLQNNLRNIGVELVELRQEYGEPMEITGRLINPLLITPTNPTYKPHPKKVIFSGPATTILWKDGTKTTVKCQDEDVWDDEVGIAMCYLKKLLGNKGNFNNIFREAMKVAEARVKTEELSPIKGGLSLREAYEESLKQLDKKINEAVKSLMKEEK